MDHHIKLKRFEKQAMDEFYKELANEILFIIANQNRPGLPVEKLCLEFEKRVGNKLVNIVGVEEHQFVSSSRMLSRAQRRVEQASDSSVVYTINWSAEHYRTLSDDQYQEVLLVHAWKLIETHGLCYDCCDNSGNTALHFLVGTPGPSTPNLVRLLLQAGGDRLAVQTNKKGQNILHVIAGRMRAEENSNGDLVFQNEKNDDGFPNTKNRMAVLNTLTEQLSSDQLTVLITAQDEIGDTPMHEWALSASTRGSSRFVAFRFEHEMEIALQLLRFGAQLRLPNSTYWTRTTALCFLYKGVRVSSSTL